MIRRVRVAGAVLALLAMLVFGDAFAFAGTTCAMHLQMRGAATCA